MYAALADVDVEHVGHHFLHPFEGQVLPCMEISDKPFDIVAIAYRGTGHLGEIGYRTAPAGPLRPVGTVFRPNGLYRAMSTVCRILSTADSDPDSDEPQLRQ